MREAVQSIYDGVLDRNPGQPEFHQAVKEVFELSLIHISEPTRH